MKRYETLAQEISESIATGAFRPGHRLPSVRGTSQSRGVSASTVFHAYYLLEARGLVEPRARSGYFVSNASTAQIEPTTSEPPAQEREVGVSELVFEILGHARNRSLVPLGSAFPSPKLFPLPKLALAMGKVARNLDAWKTVDDLTPGSADLRRQIGLRYLAMGCNVDVQELVITHGAMEALNQGTKRTFRCAKTKAYGPRSWND